MGKIKKILENELAGGTQTTDVYPVTSTKAVYDANNKRLDEILSASDEKLTELSAEVSDLSDKINGVDKNYTYVATTSYIDVVLADIGIAVGESFTFSYDGTQAMTSSTQRIGTTNGKNQPIVNNGDGTYTQNWNHQQDANTDTLRFWVEKGDTIVIFGEKVAGLEQKIEDISERMNDVDSIEKEIFGESVKKQFQGNGKVSIPFADINVKEEDVVEFEFSTAIDGVGVANGSTYLNNIKYKQVGDAYKATLIVSSDANKGKADNMVIFCKGVGIASFDVSKEGVIERIDDMEHFRKNHFVKSICHRGYSQLAPEDTLPAIAWAKKKGFDYVEADLWFTLDGVPVIVHERNLSVVSNGSGNIDEVTYEYFKTLDFGQGEKYQNKYVGLTAPSFEELVIACKMLGLNIYLDCKRLSPLPVGYESGADVVRDILQKYNMVENTTFIVGLSGLAVIRKSMPKARILYMIDGEVGDADINAIAEYVLDGDSNTAGIDVSVYDLSIDVVQKCRSANICCEGWIASLDINGYHEDIAQWLSYGIDGLTSDGADIVSAAISNYL